MTTTDTTGRMTRSGNAVLGAVRRATSQVPALGLVALLAIMWMVASFTVPNFGSAGNVGNILQQSSDLVVAATGVMFVLLAGGIDLSIGSVYGIGSVVLSGLVLGGVEVFLAILIAVTVAGVAGFVNGVLTHYGRIPSFIMTLGMYYVLFAVAQILSNGQTLNLPAGTALQTLARGNVAGLPITVIVAVFAAVVAWLLLNRTVFGRRLVSVGLNPEASRLSGIPVGPVIVGAFVLSSLFAGIASVILTARVQSGTPALGGLDSNFEVITAAVVGGTSLFGGRGTVLGVVVGALIIRTIGNCITLLDISPLLYQAVMGSLILIALIVEAIRTRQEVS